VHPSGLPGCVPGVGTVGRSEGLARVGAGNAVDRVWPPALIEPAEEAGTKAVSRGVLLPETENQSGRSLRGVARPPARRTNQPAAHQRAAGRGAEGWVGGTARDVFAPGEPAYGGLRDDAAHDV
jgi:hypothetical protein